MSVGKLQLSVSLTFLTDDAAVSPLSIRQELFGRTAHPWRYIWPRSGNCSGAAVSVHSPYGLELLLPVPTTTIWWLYIPVKAEAVQGGNWSDYIRRP